ncbi:ClpX C4-type zinc finger protein [Arthrobacter sunyaminii]|uniref:ClpX C4-type zinc finger protein n=2 Tax=Arthrobacter TaxID=1663 RepID=UPI000CE2FB4E
MPDTSRDALVPASTAAPFMCSFCLRSRKETGLLAGAPTASICRDCAARATALLDAAPVSGETLPDTPWGGLSDDELMARLPQVAEAREQVEAHLRRWVEAARVRGISWASIGSALGMSRQSAWERFRQH